MVFVMLLFIVNLVSAVEVSVATGIVTFTKLNMEPIITSISFSSEVVEGKTISCDVEFWDENPESVVLKTEWFVNEELVFIGDEFSDFEEGDIVGCMVLPTDKYGSIGTSMGLSIQAQGKSGFTKFVDAITGLF